MTLGGTGESAARAVEEGSYCCCVVGDMGSALTRPLCSRRLRAVDTLFAKPPDTTSGQRHELVMRTVASLLPAGEDGCPHLVNPLVGDRPDHVCMAELAADREPDDKVRLFGVTLHFDPIVAVVRDAQRQVRTTAWPRCLRVPYDAQ